MESRHDSEDRAPEHKSPSAHCSTTIDAEGNLYLTGCGVTVFDKASEQIEHIDVADPWTAKITFGGQDRDLLFITASKNVYGLKMRVNVAR